MGVDKDDLIDSRVRLSAANKGALRVLGRTPIKAIKSGGTQFADEFSGGGESR